MIPRCAGAGGGLCVFDHTDGAWVDAERGAPADVCLVMAGESLHRATNLAWLPGMHEVRHARPSVPRAGPRPRACAGPPPTARRAVLSRGPKANAPGA